MIFWAHNSSARRANALANLPCVTYWLGIGRPGWFTNLYTFDLLDNKIEDDMDATGSSASSLVTSYQYDANQNLVQITKPNGNIIQYDYDERNLRIAQRVVSTGAQNQPVEETRKGDIHLF